MVKDEKYSSKIKKYNHNKSETIVDKKDNYTIANRNNNNNFVGKNNIYINNVNININIDPPKMNHNWIRIMKI